MSRAKSAVFITLTAGVFLSIACVTPAYENDREAPTAFVEGTRDYTIKTFDDIRDRVLAKYINENMLILFDLYLAKLKKENAELLQRSKTLKAQQQFLQESDPSLLSYRRHLTELTELMFGLIEGLRLDKRSPEELREISEQVKDINKEIKEKNRSYQKR